MTAYELPTSLNISGVDFSIRTDFRAIIDILIAMNDPELDEQAKAVVMLQILFEDWQSISSEYLDEASVPAERVEKEKEILTQQIVDEGKPANIAEKIVAGRLNKFFKEICLVDQVYVQDSSMTVKQYTESVAKELGGDIKIAAYTRFEKGEGLEKRQDDFAAEVAGMVK